MFVTAQSILKYTERGRARWGVEETPWQLPMHGAAVGVHNFGRVTATECSADAHRAAYHSGRQGDFALLAHIPLEVCEVRPTTPPPPSIPRRQPSGAANIRFWETLLKARQTLSGC